MQQQQPKAQKPRYWLYPLKGAAIIVFLLILKTITSARIMSLVSSEDMSIQDFPVQLLFALALIASLLILNSLIHTFALYDRDALEKFLEREDKKVRFPNELLHIMRSPEFILETGTILLLTALLIPFGVFYEVCGTIYGDSPLPEPMSDLLPLLLLPIFFLISLFCHYEIQRYRAELHKLRDTERLNSIPRLVLKVVLIALLYPLVFPYTPYLIFMIVSFASIVGVLVNLLSLLGFILAVAAIFLISYGILNLRYNKKRRIFFKRLSQIVSDRGYKLKVLSKEERDKSGGDFELQIADKLYSCRVIKALRRGTPLYFTSDKHAHFLHRIGTKNHHFSLEKHFNYRFEGDGKKILIVIKFPKYVFASSAGAVRRLTPGDRVWNYGVFDTIGFLGSADRDCLDRYDPPRA